MTGVWLCGVLNLFFDNPFFLHPYKVPVHSGR